MIYYIKYTTGTDGLPIKRFAKDPRPRGLGLKAVNAHPAVTTLNEYLQKNSQEKLKLSHAGILRDLADLLDSGIVQIVE